MEEFSGKNKNWQDVTVPLFKINWSTLRSKLAFEKNIYKTIYKKNTLEDFKFAFEAILNSLSQFL